MRDDFLKLCAVVTLMACCGLLNGLAVRLNDWMSNPAVYATENYTIIQTVERYN